MPYREIKNKKSLLVTTFIMCIIFTISFYLSYTFGSVFLSQYFTPGIISIIYFTAFILTLYISSKISQKINKYHSYELVSTLLTVNTFTNIAL
ncbi:MAG: hypothetical protein QM532_02480 [Cyanobium sp. MAG06]|nr:hypothetical protein [Cyanobium sp. MAG06]